MSEDGRVFTFGSKDSGKLGHGRESIWGRVGQVAEIAEYYDVDGQTQLPRVKIGYVRVATAEPSFCMCGSPGSSSQLHNTCILIEEPIKYDCSLCQIQG